MIITLVSFFLVGFTKFQYLFQTFRFAFSYFEKMFFKSLAIFAHAYRVINWSWSAHNRRAGVAGQLYLPTQSLDGKCVPGKYDVKII